MICLSDTLGPRSHLCGPAEWESYPKIPDSHYLSCWNKAMLSPFDNKESFLMFSELGLGTVFPCLEELIGHVHSKITLWYGPIGFRKSDSLLSFCSIFIPFSSNWQCFCWCGWLDSCLTVITVSLSNACSAILNVLFRTSFINFYNVYKLRTFQIVILISFYLTIPSSIYLSLLKFYYKQEKPSHIFNTLFRYF